MCNVCKNIAQEKIRLEEARFQQEQMKKQLEERCRDQIQQRIKQQICQIELEHQSQEKDKEECKEEVHHHKEENHCHDHDGAFGEQETFLINRQVNTELGAFYSYLSLVGISGISSL